MFLKNDLIIASLDGVVMTSHLNPQLTSQYTLDPTAFSGWLDGVSTRRRIVERAEKHGDFSERATLASRVITFQGIAISTTIAGLRVLRDKLMGVFIDGEYGTLAVTTGDGTRYATVGLEGKPSWVSTTDLSANWKIDLYAPDPFIYGEQRTVQIGADVLSGGISYPLEYPLDFQIVGMDTAQVLDNIGNAQAWPIFKVIGDYYSGFTISNNLDKKITYNGLVTKQAPVTVDMAKGTAIQNGIDKTTLVSDRRWFSIPPNGSIRPNFVPIQNGSGWCDIIFRNTWI